MELPISSTRARHFAGATIAAATLVAVGALIPPATAAPHHAPHVIAAEPTAASSSILQGGTLADSAAGQIDYTVYLPPGYDADLAGGYPSIYLLHGRGDTQAAWQRMQTTLDSLITSGRIAPLIAVMPDAPWNSRGNWYTDSLYTGSAASGAGVAVETAFTTDLVAHIDANFATVTSRESRAVGGYSMGGAGALRYALAHQDIFSAGIILSPAAYSPNPPSDSSAREYGAYGVGDSLFDADRYAELSYDTALSQLDPALPVHLFIAVGDDEWATPIAADSEHDIDFESAKLYNKARRVPGISAELRIMNGGHDWDVWAPAFEEAIVDVASRLRTEPAPVWDGTLLGSAESDWAGGITELSTDSAAVALNLAGAWNGYEPLGGLDTVLAGVTGAGEVLWQTPLATAGNDRAYGVARTGDDSLVVAGYSRGRFGTDEVAGNDDAYVAQFNLAGELIWVKQFGDADVNDRIYAVTADGNGGSYVAGYTNGSFAGVANAGDKDAVVAQISADGELLWSAQIGGSGEDKALAVAALPGGGVVVGGNHGNGLPGASQVGDYDAWIAAFDAAGNQQWIQGIGSALNEQVSGIAVADGVIVATGHTKGSLGGENLGDNDAFVVAFDLDGAQLWSQQLGTETDDRGAVITAQADGTFALLVNTYGAMGEAFGSVDIARVALDADGTVGEVIQFGSRDRDGADDWDEANLFASAGGTGLWISGVTWGAPSGAVNAGASDVFMMRLTDAVVEPDPDPEPTGTPTEEPTGEPTDEPTPAPTTDPIPTDPGSSPSSEPSADPSDPAGSTGGAPSDGSTGNTAPATAPTGSAPGGELGATGVAGIWAVSAIATLLAAFGVVLVIRRRTGATTS